MQQTRMVGSLRSYNLSNRLTKPLKFLFAVLTIFGTSVYGGAVIATSLDYFFERMMMLKWVSILELFASTRANYVHPLCSCASNAFYAWLVMLFIKLKCDTSVITIR